MLGVDCTSCRAQYARSKRRPPCDTDKCGYTPSPGDTGPDGCGLLPENQEAIHLYNRWKALGDGVWQLYHRDLDRQEASLLLDKLYLIEQYAPRVAEANQRRSERAAAPGKKKKGK